FDFEFAIRERVRRTAGDTCIVVPDAEADAGADEALVRTEVADEVGFERRERGDVGGGYAPGLEPGRKRLGHRTEAVPVPREWRPPCECGARVLSAVCAV